jgi:hypothetical protein
MDRRMNDVLTMEEIQARTRDDKNYLVYVMPPDYIMQGLIADTGPEWRLYHRHFTISRFLNWVLHPFSHLSGGHHQDHDHAPADETSGMARRLIFLDISGGEIDNPYDFFSINMQRTPQFMIDVDLHTMKLLQLKDLTQDTGWGKLPTPMF